MGTCLLREWPAYLLNHKIEAPSRRRRPARPRHAAAEAGEKREGNQKFQRRSQPEPIAGACMIFSQRQRQQSGCDGKQR